MSSPSSPHAPAPRAAFSLVEMVLALGVASFAMVALLALIPLGLKTSRDAIDATLRSQMTQSITSQIQQDGFGSLDKWQGGKFYFDGEGDPVESATSPLCVFTAEVQVKGVQVTTEIVSNTAARMISINISGRGSSQPADIVNLVVANTGS